MRFFPSLVRQLRGCSQDGSIDMLARAAFTHLWNELESDNCKRLIFDARQAKVFDESEEIDERRRDKIHAPFKFFYMELTEPIMLKSQEPGCLDKLWAILWHQDLAEAIEVLDHGKNRRGVMVTKATFFYRSQDDIQFVDRTWSISPEGYPMVGRPPKSVTTRYTVDQGEGATGLANPSLLPDYVKDEEMVSVFELQERDWWEIQ
jgi:hypothetical protein